MIIKDLIKQLQDLDATYDAEYREVMGEPEIMIDVFSKVPDTEYMQYSGFCKYVKIEKSGDGVYDILSGFSQSYPQRAQKRFKP